MVGLHPDPTNFRTGQGGACIGRHAGRAAFSAYPGAEACQVAEETRLPQAALPEGRA
jgi:hypothetical protein